MSYLHLSPEEKLNRFEDLREIKNLMGRLSAAYLACEQATMFERFWSRQDDVSLATNKGYFVGAEAITAYYVNQHERIALASDLLQKHFPDDLAKLSAKEVYGVGHMDYKPVENHVIEVAGDRKTAKGLWCLRGAHAAMTPGGPQAMWEWGWFAVDFVWENDEWKIWHLQYIQDVVRPTGNPWHGPAFAYETLPQFAALADFKEIEPSHPVKIHEMYHSARAFSPAPRTPEAYATFSETFSYGYEGGKEAAV